MIVSSQNYVAVDADAEKESQKRKLKFQFTMYDPLDASEDGGVAFQGTCTRTEFLEAVAHILTILKD